MQSGYKLEDIFLAILLLIALVGLLWLFSPFLEVLLFAMILATATYKLYEIVLIRVKGSETMAAMLTSFAMFLTMIGPVTYLILEVSLQAGRVYSDVTSWLSSQTPDSFRDFSQQIIQLFPIPKKTQEELFIKLQENSNNIIEFAQDGIVLLSEGIYGNTASFLTFMFLALFALYFFYRDGKKIVNYLIFLSPLDNFYDRMIVTRFANLSTILLVSILSIALLQGLSFAILSWFLGLPGLFLGMAIAVTSFMPFIGSALVWLPVSAFFALHGDYISAGIVAFLGAVINGFVIDNIIRPILINKISDKLNGAKEDLVVTNHTLITVLATFAGLIHFGIMGLFFGPVIAAIAITIFDVYSLKNSNILDKS